MLCGELYLVGWWLADPRRGVAGAVDGVWVTVVDVRGHADPRMPVVMVVRVHEIAHEPAGFGEGAEPVG